MLQSFAIHVKLTIERFLYCRSTLDERADNDTWRMQSVFGMTLCVLSCINWHE
jgi:hypothetical protein